MCPWRKHVLPRRAAVLPPHQGDLAIAIEEYRVAVGRKPGALVHPGSVPAIPNTVDQAKAIALQYHPDMLSQQIRVTIAELNVLRAKAAIKPTVSLSGSISATEDLRDADFSNSASITLGASGTIYDGGRLTALVRQAIATRDAELHNLHVVRHNVEQNVGNAYARLAVAGPAGKQGRARWRHRRLLSGAFAKKPHWALAQLWKCWTRNKSCWTPGRN